MYDTVTVKGWSVDIRTHRIGEIINKVLVDPWPTESEDPKNAAQTAWSWWGWGRKGPGKGKTGHEGEDDDDGGWERHGGVPKAEAEDDCVDCYRWSVVAVSEQQAELILVVRREFGDGWDKKGKDTNGSKGV